MVPRQPLEVPGNTPGVQQNVACAGVPLPQPSAPQLAEDCWILAGPTAAGKTSLALELAGRLDAEILSVDSMAVYRGLDIGTAKPSPEERAHVPHHLIDLVAPDTCYNVARWLADAAKAVADCRQRGRKILFVGGTPLYLRALRDGLAPLPPENPALRERLRQVAIADGPTVLHRRLTAIDPEAATRIHPHDVKRLVRALEVIEATGQTPGRIQGRGPRSDNACSAAFARQMLVMDLPRRLLHERIDQRVEWMFATGLVEEAAAVRQASPDGIGFSARQAAGYAEAIAVLEHGLPISAAIERTQRRTRQLAKRQLTWLRSFPDAIWITV
jgi:tRNA dimethylallyltransferase